MIERNRRSKMTKLMLIVAFAAIAMLFAACGGNADEKKVETKTAEVNVNAPAANASNTVTDRDADDVRTANTSAMANASNRTVTNQRVDADDNRKPPFGNSNTSVNRRDADDRGRREGKDDDDH